MNELVQNADQIWIGQIQELKDYHEDGVALHFDGFLEQHADHAATPAKHFTDLRVAVQENLYGDLDDQVIKEFRAPFGKYLSGQGSELSFGITQKDLPVNQTYLFFLKHLTCEPHPTDWVADFYLGVMEISPDQKLVPNV